MVQELLYDPLSLEVIADYQEKSYPGCNLSCVFDRSKQPSDMQSRKNTENLTDELSFRTTFNSFQKSPAKHRENWATGTVCTMGDIKFVLFDSERIETISYQLFIKDTYGSL